MKTKEFIKRVKELGFEIIRAGGHIDIIFNDCIFAGVYTDRMHVMTFYPHEKLLLTNVDILFELLVEYAKTPIEDREEEKKYYLKHRWLEGTEECNYLNFDINGLYYSLNTKPEARWSKTKFTINGIKEIKEKFNTDLADFELVEVEDED